jgi:small-conductance mechanosensitive channel/CRP-like cAMP-binding protein
MIDALIVIAVICVLGLVFLNILRIISHGAKDAHFIGLFARRNLLFLVLLFVVGLFRIKIWADTLPQDGLSIFERIFRLFPIPGAAGLDMGSGFTLGQFLDVVLVACAAFVVIKTVMILIFDYALKRGRDVDVPGIIRALIRWSAYLVTISILMHFVLHWDISSLLAGSAIVSLVLGFALQDTLSNLFMGLSIHFERSIQVGHWIKVGDFEGQVAGVTWRSINIRTFSGDYVIVPNVEFGKMEVTNFSLPTSVHAVNVFVGAMYSDSPNAVHAAALEACARTHDVLTEPKPKVFTEAFSDSAVTYRVKAWINDYGKYPTIMSGLRSNIWYVFKRRGITIPFPIRTVYMHQVKEATAEEIQARGVDMLKRVYFLSSLTDADLRVLADGMREMVYAAGEDVVHEGDHGEDFFMVREGELNVSKKAHDAQAVAVGTLKDGAYFGEMSLLTGDKRTATVSAVKDSKLIAIGRHPFEKVLRAKPEIAEHMSQTIAERMASNAAAMGKYKEESEKARAAAVAEDTKTMAAKILGNIKNLLRL